MIDAATIDTTARELYAQYQNQQPYRPLPEALRAGELADAYRIQEAFQHCLMAAGHGAIVGYKIALTSKAMQEMCGVDQPLAGAIFASRVHHSPAHIPLANFQHLGVEFEAAVTLAADLPASAGPYTRASVAAAVAACSAAFELVEDRYADYKTMDAFSLVADNCWNGGVVLGRPVHDWRALDLETAPTRLWINEQAAGTGKAGDALGHPFEAVAWLANLLNQHGKLLKKNMVVMTGSSITTKFPTHGDTLRFAIDGIGEISLTLV